MIPSKLLRAMHGSHPVWCSWCGTEIEEHPEKPCPTCGLYGRTYVEPISLLEVSR